MATKDPIVMYLLLRRDLLSTLNWPIGALIAQGCHAATAVVWTHKDDQYVRDYMADMDSMRKVTLEVDSEPSLHSISEKLTTAGIDHKLWIEQPENIATCLAVKPYPKSMVQAFVKGLKLFK